MRQLPFREANGATDEPLDPCAQIDMFTLGFLCIGLAHCVLRGVGMALVGAPPSGVETVDAKRLEHRFELQKDGILAPPKDVRQHAPTGVMFG